MKIFCSYKNVFSASVFCSQKYLFTQKLNLQPKVGLTYDYGENLRKIEQLELIENLPRNYQPNRFLCNLHSFLLWENWKYLIFW